MFNALTSWLRPAPARRPRPAPAGRVEALEDRTVLDTALFNLLSGAFTQDWSNVGLISADDNWGGVASITGYSGTGLGVSGLDVDPRSVTAASAAGTAQVYANVTATPDGYVNTGLAEFQALSNPVVGLRPDTTKQAPNLVVYLNTTGVNAITVDFDARDIDGSTRNSAQQVAVEYRIGNTGNFIPLSPPGAGGAGYQADVTVQGNTASTHIAANLPAAANNQPEVQVRILTTVASGGDNEWVGIDNIAITGNRRPTVTTTSGSDTYVENAPATAIDPPIAPNVTGVAVNDPDSATFNGGSLLVTIANVQAGEDVLAVNNQGAAAGQIGYNSTTRVVTYGGTRIGIVDATLNGQGGQPLRVNFDTAAATPTSATALARNITYRNTSDDPNTATRVVQFVVADGAGGTSAAGTKNIDITAVNDAPVVTTPGGQSTPQGTALSVLGVSVSDPDVRTANVTATITVPAAAGTLTIRTNVSGGVTAAQVSGNNTATLVVTAPLAALNATLAAASPAGLVYTPGATYNTDTSGPFNLTFSINDNGNTPTPAQTGVGTISVTVSGVNHAPVLTPDPGNAGAIAYPLATPFPTVFVAPAGTVTDPDLSQASGNLTPGVLTVSVTLGSSLAADPQAAPSPNNNLRINNEGFGVGQVGLQGNNVTYRRTGTTAASIIGSFTGGTGTTPLNITFNGAEASPAAVQELLRNITYTATSFDTATRYINFRLTDGVGNVPYPYKSRVLTPQPINSAPSFTLPGTAAPAVAEDTGAVAVAGFATNVSPGVAGFEQTQTLTFHTSTTNNALFAVLPTLTRQTADPTLADLSYTPAANASGTATVTVYLTDDGGTTNNGADTSASQTFTITVTPVADTPTVSPAAPGTTEDTATGPITVSRNAADGAEVGYFKVTAVHGGTVATAGGTAVANGDFVAFGTGLVFTPAADANTGNTPGGFGFSVQAATSNTDAGLGGGVVPVSVTVAAANDAPVVGGVPAVTSYLVSTAGGTTPVAPAGTVTDVDSADFNGGALTVAFTGGTGRPGDTLAVRSGGSVLVVGTAVSVGGNVVGTVSGGTGGTTLTVQFTTAAATPAAAQAVLDAVVFSTTAGNGDRTVAVGVADGDGGTGTATTIIRVTDHVTVQSLAPTATPTAARTALHWILTTDLAESGFTATNFSLTGSLAGVSTIGTPTAAGPNTVDVPVTVDAAAGSGTLQLNLVNDAGLTTPIGNLPFTGQTVAVDRTGPVVTGFTNGATSGTVPVNQPVTYTVTFDTPVDVSTLQPADFSNAGSSPITVANITPVNPVAGSPTTATSFTFTVTPLDGSSIQIQVPASATIADALGNPLVGQYPDSTILQVDASLPAVAGVSNNTTSTPANVAAAGQPITYTVVFSEAVDPNTVSAADFANAGSTPVTIGTVTRVNAATYTVVVTPTTVGTVQLRVGPNISDLSGNPMAAAATDPTVVVVNAPPAAAGDSYPGTTGQPLLEDGAFAATAARGLLANDTDPNDPTTSLTVDTTPVAAPTKGTLVLAADGSFTYTPYRDANGTDSFQYRVRDTHGGSAVGTVTLSITPVNDPPTFTLAPAAGTAEDAGPFAATVATNLTAGGTAPYTESEPLAGFVTTVLAADPTLAFTAAPSVDAAGRLTFTPAPNAYGTATISVRLRDTGGTANGGQDTSPPQTLTITVTPVNDAPTFALAGNPPTGGTGPQTVPGFASFNPGPNESGQTPAYTLAVTGTTGGLQFAVAPAIDANGTLTYTAAPGTAGTATVAVGVRDSGGTANGGQDTAANTQSFVVIIPTQPGTPTANPDGTLVAKDAGPTFIDVLANDTPAPAGSRLLMVASVTQPAHGTATVAPGGRGVLYTPAPGFSGTDTFGYTLIDGDFRTAFGTVTVTIRPVPAGQPRFDEVAIGAGPGGGPIVRVNSLSTGAFTATFAAYDPGFRGGVNVGVGDVNGDGVPDVVTTAGFGGGPHVKVIDGTKLGLVNPDGSIADAAVLASFFAYDPAFRGGVTVTVADVDGDGKADILTGTGNGGGAAVKVISGARIGLPAAADGEINPGAVLASFFAYDPAFRGGVSVTAGDVDGDGVADIITAAGAGGGSHVKVFSGLGGPVIRSFFAYEPGFTGGVSVAAGDVNGDGKADIITGAGVGGGPAVKVFDSAGGVLASFFALSGGAAGADVAYRVTRDAVPLVVVGAQLGESQIRTYAAPDFQPYNGFDAFDPSFLGGVEVG